MKIAFFVSCIHSKSNGNGGHYHSLVTLYKAMLPTNELLIINIGTNQSNTIEKENIKLYNVLSPNLNYKKNKKIISEIIQSEKPDVIHAFDHFALFWARVIGVSFKIPFCVTKCGGRNPKHYFPYVKDIILFSNENHDYFKLKAKFNDCEFYMIPNRVFPFESSKERMLDLESHYPVKNYSFKFLRICRIGNAFKNSILQLMSLVERLNKDGFSCCLVIIGVVENQEIYEELVRLSDKNVYFINDERFIKNAKELIGISDFVLGTGRSFMEASSLGKIMMAPIKNSKMPLLIQKDNIKQVMDYNFSERFSMEEYDSEQNYNEIVSILTDSKKKESYMALSKDIFDDYFNIESVISKYELLYKKMKCEKEQYIDLFMHFNYVLKEYKFKL
jgi:hypothetical protein